MQCFGSWWDSWILLRRLRTSSEGLQSPKSQKSDELVCAPNVRLLLKWAGHHLGTGYQVLLMHLWFECEFIKDVIMPVWMELRLTYQVFLDFSGLVLYVSGSMLSRVRLVCSLLKEVCVHNESGNMVACMSMCTLSHHIFSMCIYSICRCVYAII